MLSIRLTNSPEESRQALRFLQTEQPEAYPDGLDNLLELNETNQLDQLNFLIAECPERSELAGAMLLIYQSDGAVTFYPPVLADISDPSDATNSRRSTFDDQMLKHALNMTRERQCNFIQSLLHEDDEKNRDLWNRHGLPFISTLLIFIRPTNQPKSIETELPTLSLSSAHSQEQDFSLEPALKFDPSQFQLVPVLEEHDHPEFAQLLEQTYENSADFPELLGIKNGVQALSTHRLQGKFEPAHWYRISYQQTNCGALLFAWHENWKQWELIYLGLVPEFRGLGLARYSIQQILSNEEIGKQPVFLGVDSRNHFAIRLYRSLGFVAVGRQQVHFRWLTDQTNWEATDYAHS